METRVIRVSRKTYADLAKRGTLRDTFDTVIRRLLTRESNIKTENGDIPEQDSVPNQQYPIQPQSPLREI
jgi:hypothetical protein